MYTLVTVIRVEMIFIVDKAKPILSRYYMKSQGFIKFIILLLFISSCLSTMYMFPRKYLYFYFSTALLFIYLFVMFILVNNSTMVCHVQLANKSSNMFLNHSTLLRRRQYQFYFDFLLILVGSTLQAFNIVLLIPNSIIIQIFF